MSAYADSSFLVSVYTSDANSPEAALVVKSASLPFLLTPFVEFEVMNAFHLRLFRGEIHRDQLREATTLFRADLKAGTLAPVEMPADVYQRAREISTRFTDRLGVRALDILHVACAIALAPRQFHTFDKAQLRLAKAMGLRTA